MAIANRSMPPGVFIPVLAYPELAPAVKWLCDTFGFTEHLRVGNHRVQLTYGGASIIVTAAETPTGGGSSIMVRVEDVARHYQHVLRSEAEIIQAPTDHPYGERQYTVEDPAGYRWTFSQSIADVDPKDWSDVMAEETSPKDASKPQKKS